MGDEVIFLFMEKAFDEAAFYFIRDIFVPQQAVFYFFVTFLSDAGVHLDLSINLALLYQIIIPFNIIQLTITASDCSQAQSVSAETYPT